MWGQAWRAAEQSHCLDFSGLRNRWQQTERFQTPGSCRLTVQLSGGLVRLHPLLRVTLGHRGAVNRRLEKPLPAHPHCAPALPPATTRAEAGGGRHTPVRLTPLRLRRCWRDCSAFSCSYGFMGPEWQSEQPPYLSACGLSCICSFPVPCPITPRTPQAPGTGVWTPVDTDAEPPPREQAAMR